MNSRERVFAAIDHKTPDRVPFNLRPSAEMVNRLRREQGDVDFAQFFGHDVRYVSLPLPERPEGIEDYDWLPRFPEVAVEACAREAKALRDEGLAVCSAYICGVFEHFKHWFGDERALTMPYEDPDRPERELDRIAEWKTDLYCAYARAGVDIVWIGDDVGSQKSLIMSPEQYRRWYRPRHARIIAALRAINPDVRIAFHCCGYITTLIPDLIEIGVDILEAVQAECMDLAELKRAFGRDITYWGGVGAQSVLARTTPEQVIEGVRATLAVMAPTGGYIAAPCHTLTDEVPWESVLAFHEAMRRYGAYPSPGEAP